MIRCTVKRWGERWRLEVGDKRTCVVSSPDRGVVVGAAHSILRAYNGLLVVYDIFHRIEGSYAYRDGIAFRGLVAQLPLSKSH